MKTINHFTRLMRDDDAAISAEYALLAAVVATALVAALAIFKDDLTNTFNSASDGMANAPITAP